VRCCACQANQYFKLELGLSLCNALLNIQANFFFAVSLGAGASASGFATA